jgi:V8-like Glu-specific endopeptidase
VTLHPSQVFGNWDIIGIARAKAQLPSDKAAKLEMIARSVAYVKTPQFEGTGFLIQENLLMTNNHVFTNHERRRARPGDAAGATAIFNFEDDVEGSPLPVETYDCQPRNGFYARLKLDYSVVAIEGAPGQTWGVLSMQPSRQARRGDRVFIVQHPDGAPKAVAMAENEVLYVGEEVIQYKTDTVEGSSGSPVFNEDFELIALHHSSGAVEEPTTGQRFFRNEGLLITVIRDDLRRHRELRSF